MTFCTCNKRPSQAYRIPERDIQLCPNFCDGDDVRNEYCAGNQPRYVKARNTNVFAKRPSSWVQPIRRFFEQALGAEVRSDRCCDEERWAAAICLWRKKQFAHFAT